MSDTDSDAGKEKKRAKRGHDKILQTVREQLMEEIFSKLMEEGPSKIKQHRNYVKLMIHPGRKHHIPKSCAERIKILLAKVSSSDRGEMQQLFEAEKLPALMGEALVCPMFMHTPQSVRRLYVYSVLADVLPHLVAECATGDGGAISQVIFSMTREHQIGAQILQMWWREVLEQKTLDKYGADKFAREAEEKKKRKTRETKKRAKNMLKKISSGVVTSNAIAKMGRRASAQKVAGVIDDADDDDDDEEDDDDDDTPSVHIKRLDPKASARGMTMQLRATLTAITSIDARKNIIQRKKQAAKLRHCLLRAEWRSVWYTYRHIIHIHKQSHPTRHVTSRQTTTHYSHIRHARTVFRLSAFQP